MIEIFLKTFCMFTGALCGILIILLPVAAISYVGKRIYLQHVVSKANKQYEKDMQEKVDEMNDRVNNTQYP